MKILHVLSQFEVTGAEVYAATLANEQVRRGHEVTLVSDTLSVSIDSPYVQLPVGNRSYPQRLRNIAALVALIRTLHIDVVHAHSRAASWVSFVATRLADRPLVSTIHGRQHLHLSSKSFNIYGCNVIAVSESLRDHLIQELGSRSEDIAVIPNGIDLNQWNVPVPYSKKKLFGIRGRTKMILFVGRLSGPKGDVVRFLISHVLPEIRTRIPCILCIVGGFKVPDDIPRIIDTANAKAKKPVIILKEFQRGVIPFMLAADVVVASGRVAIESLITGRPTIAFGESNYHGLITKDNIEEAARTNFGDTGTFHAPVLRQVTNDLLKTLSRNIKSTAVATKSFAEKTYDITVIEPKIEKVYEKAIVKRNSPVSIPVLMYHRVVPSPPRNARHGIWVTIDRFKKQLQSLRVRGYSTITFEDYYAFSRGEVVLPPQPVILTFDDGYEDNYRLAFPLLMEFGFKAVIYLVTEQKRRTNFWDPDEPVAPLMTFKQVKEMKKEGIEFGSHSISHPKLPDLPLEKADREIKQSKVILEQILGSPVLSFAYPYGAASRPLKELVEQAAFLYAVAGNSGPTTFYEDFFEIRRTQVFPWTGAYGFWKKTQPWYVRYKRFSLHF